MPPATLRAFGFETVLASEWESYEKVDKKQAAIDSHGVNEGCNKFPDPHIENAGKNPRIYKGLGQEVGPVTIEDGSKVQGGRLLMRDTWNADVTPELKQSYEEGKKANPPDVWIHKNRMSGLWGDKTDCTEFLEKEGIKTLFFAGVNTDQCVGGSLQDVSPISIFSCDHVLKLTSPGIHKGLRLRPPLRWCWDNKPFKQSGEHRIQLRKDLGILHHM